VSAPRVLQASAAALSILAAAGAVATAQSPLQTAAVAGALTIRIGQAKELSHIEFRWAGGAKMSARRDGQTLILRFSRNAHPDLARLRVSPPQFLKTAEARTVNGRLELALTLTDEADATSGFADGAAYVNLFKRRDQPAAPPDLAAAAGPPRQNPAPDSGVVIAQAAKSGTQLTVNFPWKAALGAAVFRRGEAVWVVFDGKARLDVRAVQRLAPQYAMREVDGPDYTALRIAASRDLPFSVSGAGATWTLTLGPGPQAKAEQVAIGRDTDDDGPPALAAKVAGTTRIAWVDDPVVGDRLGVAMALAPAKGVLQRRAFVDLAVLASAQGLAIDPAADGLQLASDGDVVRIRRPQGLRLSASIRQTLAAETDLPQPTAMPGLIDFDRWPRAGAGGYMRRYQALMSAAAAETNRQAVGDKTAGVAARMGLARFLAGNELAFEAIGVLDMTAKSHPELMSNAEFRGIRGAAKVMAGRYKEAQADFSSPALSGDPASALWTGYADAKLGQWTDAREAFQSGGSALPQVSGVWRARFARANAEAALQLNDFATATRDLSVAMQYQKDPAELLATLLVKARLVEAQGYPDKALPIYDAIARAPLDQVAAPALLHATQIRLYDGKISPDKAAKTFASLRFRWRGDATELEVIRALGQLYLAQGRYRDALEAMRSARQRMSDRPEALQIQADLSGAFHDLFLGGKADGLEPIQALALFYDFKELTPIGADGDDMVRRLAQRLVNVDLLDQAAELLKYQVENRLDGVPRAIVATDLTIIDLMARKPEDALEALNNTRTTLLPSALQAQRRLLETRTWLQLGQLDHASEILGKDNSAEGVALRAEIAWKRRDWPAAAKVFEESLGDRWKDQTQPLAPEEESKLLRAATAYSLAQDDAALARLRDRWQGFVNKARWPDALRVALSGVDVEQLTTANFAKAISDDQTFASWVAKMRKRFRDRPLGGAIPAPALRPLTTAQADPEPPPAAKSGKG
jgi:tetratricopeptide (TPR) repeat protein